MRKDKARKGLDGIRVETSPLGRSALSRAGQGGAGGRWRGRLSDQRALPNRQRWEGGLVLSLRPKDLLALGLFLWAQSAVGAVCAIPPETKPATPLGGSDSAGGQQ